jgi:ATP-dependent helicase HrpA
LKEIETLEAKTRRRDILVDEQVIYDFYAQRIPTDICSIISFESWRKGIERKEPQLLFLTRQYLMRHGASEAGEAQYPNRLKWQDISVPLSYQFEPGTRYDGVTAHIPVTLLARLPAFYFEWLVPGMLFDKCVALVKGLPKSHRKNFVPVPDYVERALTLLQRDDVSLVEALNSALSKITGSQIPIDQWQSTTLDDYYRMNFKLLDDTGAEIAVGRDLAALKQQYQQVAQQSLAEQADNPFEKADLTRWDFGDLPAQFQFKQAGMQITAYPAVVDSGESVSVKLLDSPLDAYNSSREGVVKLLMLGLPQQIKYLRKELLKSNKANLTLVGVAQKGPFIDAIIKAVFSQTFLAQISSFEQLPHNQTEFDVLLERHRADLVDNGYRYERLVEEILSLNQKVGSQLKRLNSLAWAYCAKDVKRQLSALFYPQFIGGVDFQRLQHYPRYLKAILERLERLGGGEQRDRASVLQIDEFLLPLDKKIEGDFTQLEEGHPLNEFRWLLEEYRVSLFAQQLGTQVPVSAKRLKKAWQDATTAAVRA